MLCLLFISAANADNPKKSFLKIIDKVSSKYYILEVAVNNTVIFKNIDVSSKKCIKNKENNNSFATYLTLKDRKKDKFIFKGWLLSNNISLSQVAHPIYNIKLIKCI